MAGKKKEPPRKARQKVTLWFAREYDTGWAEYQVHAAQPRLVTVRQFGGSSQYVTSKKRGGRYNNGSITELCSSDVSKALGLNLRAGEAVEVTFTFGKVVKLAGAQKK